MLIKKYKSDAVYYNPYTNTLFLSDYKLRKLAKLLGNAYIGKFK